MLDIKFIADNIELVKENIKNRQMSVDIDRLLEANTKKKEYTRQLDLLREEANVIAKNFHTYTEAEKPLKGARAKELKVEIAKLSQLLKEFFDQYTADLAKVPNLTAPDVPVGKTDKDNKVVRKHGKVPHFDFAIQDHVQLGKTLDLIDFETAAATTGAKFYFLKNEAVILELALIRFALDKALAKGYQLMATPDIARDDVITASGYSPRGAETQIYSIENTNLSLIGTSEILIGGYFAKCTFKEKQLPLKIAAVSHCFRTEAGSYGSESRGLYRVHQFSKVELYQITSPATSDAALEEIVSLEEEIYQALGIPYQIVIVCTGDLGATAYKKYDIEAWLPSKENEGCAYGEITSASNCTAYQSKRLGISCEDANNNKVLAHTLNGTAIAISRTLIALLENYQQRDGSVLIPEVLWPYTGFKKISS